MLLFAIFWLIVMGAVFGVDVLALAQANPLETGAFVATLALLWCLADGSRA